MKFHIKILQLCIVIASYVYCFVPPHLLEDHCYNLVAEESFIQKNFTPTSIRQICYRKDRKLYTIGSYNFVAWHVTIMAMAIGKINFRLWFGDNNSSLLVTGKFETIEDALDFHHEIYDDRLYDVPDQLQPPTEWRQLPESLIENIIVPFKLNKSNDIVAVAMLRKRISDSDPFYPPNVIAQPTEEVLLLYESYKQADAQLEKIFTITVANATNAKKPLITFGPQGFELVDRPFCGDFIVIVMFDVFYIISLESVDLAENLFATLSKMTPYIMDKCPPEIDIYLRFLKHTMYPNVNLNPNPNPKPDNTRTLCTTSYDYSVAARPL